MKYDIVKQGPNFNMLNWIINPPTFIIHEGDETYTITGEVARDNFPTNVQDSYWDDDLQQEVKKDEITFSFPGDNWSYYLCTIDKYGKVLKFEHYNYSD